MFRALCSRHSPYSPLPPDAEMDAGGRCRIAARHGPGPQTPPPPTPPRPAVSAGPAGSGLGGQGPFAERVPVSVRRSASRGGLGPGLTGMLASYPKGSELPSSSRWGKKSEDVTGMFLQDHRDHPAPTGREARRYQNSTQYKVQRDRFPLQLKPE